MAQLLYEKLVEYPQIRFTHKVESNQLFFEMPKPLIKHLHSEVGFFFENELTNVVRLVTSFDTTIEDVEYFISGVESYYQLNKQ